MVDLKETLKNILVELEHIKKQQSIILDSVNNEPLEGGYIECAKWTNLSLATLRSYVCNRRIPFIKKANKVYFIYSEIKKWKDAGRAEQVSTAKLITAQRQQNSVI